MEKSIDMSTRIMRQTLSAAVKQKRLERSKILLKELRSGTAGAIVWSDEIFRVKFAHSDRIFERNVKEIPHNRKTVYQTMKPASVMVWVAVSKTWRSLLIFIDQSAKINAKYYVENILEPMLKSSKNHFGHDTLWTFQQDSAASHTANVAQNWCREHILRFWSKEMWPPCFPDLNPMDFWCGPSSKPRSLEKFITVWTI